jgi:hypothetical protein
MFLDKVGSDPIPPLFAHCVPWAVEATRARTGTRDHGIPLRSTDSEATGRALVISVLQPGSRALASFLPPKPLQQTLAYPPLSRLD